MSLKLVSKIDNTKLTIKAFFKEDNLFENIKKEKFSIIEDFENNVAYFYLEQKEKFNLEALKSASKKVVSSLYRDFFLDVDSFVVNDIKQENVVEFLSSNFLYNDFELYNLKTDKKDKKYTLSLYSENFSKESKDAFEKTNIIMESVNYARNLQIMPPNILNSEVLAEEVKNNLSKYKNLKVTVLNKKQIEKHKMGLLLSVNRGSMYEARVVVIEYTGNPESKEKTVLVGKGITFDSGGYTMKSGRSMLGMKFDMSGSAAVASVMKAVAQLKPKTNISAIMCITDNRVNGDASLPDSVWTSMNGKTVEVNNTDAEGRLVMADGLTYAKRILGATRLVDLATLTGAMAYSLGKTYTGVWTTTEQAWEEMQKASKEQNEPIWRLPFDEEYTDGLKSSKVADLKNADLRGLGGGSIVAAMFLKEFTEDTEYIHIDIAETADSSEVPTGVMVKTLIQLALNSK
ncbi:M17 family metallopeptidase [Mycoplasma procyoni]|uniref:M17 family metallopeptidase n=1 Tax=Mycoplasma procyoni TaxID=568784 RepID=UPI00197C08E0|nr:M17 family metallopeptidase [Mycoplasma procyoni]MBN3534479.1 M17 family metallopeptidase [Mycoplasma procyoni]